MAHILKMPRQGNTVESCIIVDWKVKEGDQVTAETAVCEVETDKAAFEVPAGAAGTVLAILAEQGADVPVLAPIAVIGAAGEDWNTAVAVTAPAPEVTVTAPSPAPEVAVTPVTVTPVTVAPAAVIASPRARNLADREALPLPAAGTGPGGRIIERDVISALESRPALTAAAKAAGAGMVPQQGTGLAGRVTAADLASPASHSPEYTETPIKGIRKIISDRMFESLAESAQFTLNACAPVSRLQDIRFRMKASQYFGEPGLSKITVNDLILFAVSRVLPLFPFMNAHKMGDSVRTFERIHLGVAVDTPRGLMVPVIRNADLLSLAQISAEAKRLAAACQSGAAKPDEISGSTFTVTNLGSLGITNFTPILNAPEVAILGVCSIELKPVPQSKNDTAGRQLPPDFEPHIGFSLTINHQVIDGAPAARFLKALCEAVADIDLLLAAG